MKTVFHQFSDSLYENKFYRFDAWLYACTRIKQLDNSIQNHLINKGIIREFVWILSILADGKKDRKNYSSRIQIFMNLV